MKKINSSESLRQAIVLLEERQAEEGKLLKAQFLIAYDSIKPINILKNTLREAVASQELKSDVLHASVGLATGYLSQWVFKWGMRSPVKKLIGSVIMFGVTNLVAQNPQMVDALGSKLLTFFRSKRTGRVGKETNESNSCCP